MSLLVVGSVGLDSVETPSGNHDNLLGGSASYFSMAASFFAPVRMVAVVGEDFPESHVTLLEGRGVDLAGMSRQCGNTFRWKGRYLKNMNDRVTLDTQLNVFEHFKPSLPKSWCSTPFIFLGNIDPVLQSDVLEQTNNPTLVAADTMNYWINGKLGELKKTLSRVDLLFVNDSEACELSGETNVVLAARKISTMGPKSLVIKRGEYGAMLFTHGRVFTAPAFPLADVRDPTGAGDSFAGGFMGYLARAGEATEAKLRNALVVGSVMASFAVEDFSVNRFKAITHADIQQRFQGFRDLTHFEDLSPGMLRAVS